MLEISKLKSQRLKKALEVILNSIQYTPIYGSGLHLKCLNKESERYHSHCTGLVQLSHTIRPVTASPPASPLEESLGLLTQLLQSLPCSSHAATTQHFPASTGSLDTTEQGEV